MNLALILLKTEPAHPLFDAVPNYWIDIAIFILYSDFYWMEPIGIWAASVTVQYVAVLPQPSHNPISFGFLLGLL